MYGIVFYNCCNVGRAQVNLPLISILHKILGTCQRSEKKNILDFSEELE